MERNLKFNTLPKNPAFSESFDVYMCNGFSLPSFAIKFLKDEATTFKARKDDIYVVSYPKTGTTWLQQIVFLISSDLDFGSEKTSNMHQQFPYIEHAKTNFDAVVNMKSPRLLKTHLPHSLLPSSINEEKCKMIYVTRNPRDVAVSYYHFACMLAETQYKGTFEQFFERFFHDRTTYSPFLCHNLEFWNHKDDPNILFLFYEDMKKDITGNVKKIADFLGRSLSTEEINLIVEHSSFKKMANDKSLAMSPASVVKKEAKFYRKGEVGDWKNYFSQEMVIRLDQKVAEVLKDSGLEYTYEI